MFPSERLGLDGDGDREKEMGQDCKNRQRSDREAHWAEPSQDLGKLVLWPEDPACLVLGQVRWTLRVIKP